VILEVSLRNSTVVFPGCSLHATSQFGVYCKTTGLEVDPMGIHGCSFHVVAYDLSVSCRVQLLGALRGSTVTQTL